MDGTTDEEYTPLIGAVIHGNDEVAEFLINVGADVNKPLSNGTTPLYFAAEYGHLSIAQRLIEAGAEVKKARHNGATPLHVAARKGHHEIISFLLLHGGNIQALYRNHTPLQCAIQERKVQAAQCLIRAGAPVTEQDLNNAGARDCFIEIVSGVINFLKAHPEELPKYQVVMQRVLVDHHDQLSQWLSTEQGRLCAAICQLLFPDFMMAPQEFFEIGNREVVQISGLLRFFEEDKQLPRIATNRVFSQFLSVPEYKGIDLYSAISIGDVEIVKKLMPEKSVRNAFYKNYGKTVLKFAIQMNQHDVVRFLLEELIEDVNDTFNDSEWIKLKSGGNPLMIAAQYGYNKIVQLLIKAGVSSDKRDNNGVSPLRIAYQTKHYSIVELLLERGANVNQPLNDTSETLLHLAAKSGNLEVAQLAIQAGARLDEENCHGETSLFKAAQDGHCEVVKLLLQAGASVNRARSNGATPLLMAASYNFPETVKVLISAGAHVDQKTKHGSTPFIAAFRKGHVEVLNILLKAGAGPNPPCYDGINPMKIAYDEGNYSKMKFLLDHGYDVDESFGEFSGITLLILAAKDGTLKAVQLAIQAGADVNQVNSFGETPLHLAAWHGRLEIVKALLQAGAAIDQSSSKFATETPLQEAVISGHLDVVRFLIRNGACVMTDHLKRVRRCVREVIQNYSARYLNDVRTLLSNTELNSHAINTILADLGIANHS